MNYYEILGVTPESSIEEITKAYRRKAMKIHPDREGGSVAAFQELEHAYSILSNDTSRSEYDNILFQQQMPFGFSRHTFSSTGQYTQSPINYSITISLDVKLKDLLSDFETVVQVNDSQNSKFVKIIIPRGTQHGEIVRYKGLGSFANVFRPAGDLFVVINIIDDLTVNDGDVIIEHKLSCIDAMAGTQILVENFDGTAFMVNIPSGTNHGMQFKIPRKGYLTKKDLTRGDLYVSISITVPKSLTDDQMSLVKALQQTSDKGNHFG